MKKRFVALLLMCTFIVPTLVACSSADKPATNGTDGTPTEQVVDQVAGDGEFHIGLVTGTSSQGEDEMRAAESVVAKYGSVEQGGRVKHVTYPDNYDKEFEQVVQTISQLADDPLMKVIVVNQGIPGTTAAFKKIKEQAAEQDREIFLVAITIQEDPEMIAEVADLVIDPDNINRGYLMMLGAQKLGAKKFVHLSFPRHMGYEVLSRRKDILEVAAKDLGMEFISETTPDPLSDVGVPGAQQYILEQMPAWVEKYGKDTAFFTTNDAQTEPLLKRVAELGAIFVEPDLPSPLIGYPGAFGIKLEDVSGDWPAILKRVEEAVVEAGGSGRMGTWAFSYSYSSIPAMVELGIKVMNGDVDFTNDKVKAVVTEFEGQTPGAEWNATAYFDRKTKAEYDNFIMVYQDTYVFGTGPLGIINEKVDAKYKEV